MSERPQSQRDPNHEPYHEGAPERDEQAVSKFVENFALVFAGVGMPRMAARVFAALLATQEDSLTAGELSETLRVSPAAVSGAVRYLSQVNMIQRGREPGSRRDHYYLGEDIWYEMFARDDTVYRHLADALEEGVEAAGAESRAGKRISDTRDFFDFMSRQVPLLIEQWHRQRSPE